jgi:hypothetical protein
MRENVETPQFDRAIVDAHAPGTATGGGVVCAGCRAAIDREYFHVNGHIACAGCRAAVGTTASTPVGAAPFLVAAAFGAGGGIAGAAIYYAVMALAHLEIGLVAILIGYMVGYSVRKGARGRGGLRLQILAAALTYLSVALAYAPLAVGQATLSARTVALVALLPLLVIASSIPTGLISAVIIFIGMRQAWRMTAAPPLTILGPYRVGSPLASSPA